MILGLSIGRSTSYAKFLMSQGCNGRAGNDVLAMVCAQHEFYFD